MSRRRALVAVLAAGVAVLAIALGGLAREAGRTSGGAAAATVELSASPAARPHGLEAEALPQVAGDATRDQELAALAGDFTVADFRAHFAGPGAAGVISDDQLLPAAALLALHPALCAELGARLVAPTTTAAGQALMVDLLAQVGTPAAQEALRVALASPALRGPVRATLVARLGFVSTPEAATLALVAGEYDLGGSTAPAAALALGTLAGRRADEGDGQVQLERLRGDLADAEAPATAALLTTALGAAHRPEDEARFVAGTYDARPEVRGAATRALGAHAGDQATSALVAAVADPDARVQAAALGTLAGRALDGRALGAVRDALLGRRIAASNLMLVLNLVAPYAAREAALVRAVCTGVILHPEAPPAVRARAAAMRG